MLNGRRCDWEKGKDKTDTKMLADEMDPKEAHNANSEKQIYINPDLSENHPLVSGVFKLSENGNVGTTYVVRLPAWPSHPTAQCRDDDLPPNLSCSVPFSSHFLLLSYGRTRFTYRPLRKSVSLKTFTKMTRCALFHSALPFLIGCPRCLSRTKWEKVVTLTSTSGYDLPTFHIRPSHVLFCSLQTQKVVF